MDEEDRAKLAAQLVDGDVVAQHLGINLEILGHGFARVSMRVREDMSNGLGICHGGMIFTLADTGLGFACNSRNISTLAFSASIDFLNPAKLGETLTAVVSETARAGRNGIFDAVVTGEDDRVIATFRGTSRSSRDVRILADVEPD